MTTEPRSNQEFSRRQESALAPRGRYPRRSRFLPPLALAIALCAPLAAQSLEQAFSQPPDSARVSTWWHWMNGHISKDGITRDLEAMKRSGMGGALIFNVGVGMAETPGPVRTFSREWWDAVHHAMSECRRLGLKFGMHNCDGWSQSGGPWVRPEQSMKEIVWTETAIEGGRAVRARLAAPAAREGFYRDIAVLALPVSGEESIAGGRLTEDPGKWWQLEFAEPREARAIGIQYLLPRVSGFPPPVDARLEVSDGGAFRPVRTFSMGWRLDAAKTITVDFPRLKARVFRISLDKPADMKVAALTLWRAPRLGYWEPKAAFTTFPIHGGETGLYAAYAPLRDKLPAAEQLRPGDIRDLTAQLRPDGTLEWEAPAGRWVLLRAGFTSTGRRVGTATPEGRGLECDKLDRAAVEKHFDGLLGEFVRRYPEMMGGTFAFAELDSWEAGICNWTARMPAEFQRRRGYDIKSFLPVIAGGRVVESYEASERFLWDFRRTLADMLVDQYRGPMTELCQRHGIQLITEGSGRQQFLYDPLNYNLSGHVPMGEFWTDEGKPRIDNRNAASIAHTYGGRLVASESFTSGGEKHYELDPYSMKSLGDRAFTAGVNWYVLHSYVHQPYDWLRPGLALARWGAHFHRNNTWFEMSRPWYDYLARCQMMLRRGTFVADLAYFPGEDVPTYMGFRHQLNPPLPPGYDYDGLTADLLLNRAVVRNGRIELPSGMSYRALLLPDRPHMTAALARRIRELASAGATIIGPRPLASPSLAQQPEADREVGAIAAEVWGRGRVLWGKRLEDVFASLGVAPDFEAATGHADSEITYIHRREGETDIYFIANALYRPERAVCTFRVAGRAPEFWHPDTGRIEPAGEFRVVGGRTEVPVAFDPAGSLFVVFRKAGGPTPAAPVPPRPQTLDVAWQVAFPGGPEVHMPKLVSWSQSSDPQVKYFSGTAVYRGAFRAASPAAARLCLGKVKNLARVRLNGHDLGIAWKEPFCLDTGTALRAGENRLEIEVVNLWVNRMIGDEQLPPDIEYPGNGYVGKWPEWARRPGARASGRKTFVVKRFYDKDSPLLESGLLGPVTLE